MRPAAFASSGRWFRGNLHTHSDRSDGVAPVEQVIAEYRAAGYDFLVLTDHFEARWGWSLTDTSVARDDTFTTLLGAELSSADWDDEDVFWVNAIGLPAGFAAPAAGEPHAALIRRAAETGAYNVLLHPGLTSCTSSSSPATMPTGTTAGTASGPGSRCGPNASSRAPCSKRCGRAPTTRPRGRGSTTSGPTAAGSRCGAARSGRSR